MKIRSKLYLSAVVSIGLLGILSVTLLSLFIKINSELKKEAAAYEFSDAATSVLVLAHEYSAFQSTRIENSLNMKMGEIEKIIGKSRDVVPLDIISNAFKSLKTSFLELKTLRNEDRKLPERNGYLEDALMTIVLTESHKILATATRLSSEARKNVLDLQKNGILFVTLFAMVFASIIGASTLLIIRNIRRPLKVLKHSADTIGSGNLDEPVPALGNDEFGDISMALNEMRLKRKQAEKDLRVSEEKFRTLIEDSLDAIALTTPSGQILDANDAFFEMFGYNREETLRLNIRELHADASDPDRLMAELTSKGFAKNFESKRRRKDGREIICIASVTAQRDAQDNISVLQSITRDVTEMRNLQQQLLQAQKMESVGRLAGGVAHDFNNKLSVILGYVQIAMEDLGREHPIYENLQQVMNAGKQSVDIVRQLLAFARKQTIAPRVLNLNETVEGMLKMLRRLIGEDIDLLWQPDTNLWNVRMDPSQIDQILANLCVNARDAISEVGKITIETENVVLDETYCANHAGFVPGEYVILGVSDNGCGMDKETLANAFEPFFTTKQVGKGTGLGLATVYGIAKQNNGFVNIYSEPGKGTSVKIYLPRHTEEGEEKAEAIEAEMAYGHGEIILVVEDEASVLRLAERVLQKLGYRVLTAGTPAEAIHTAQDHEDKIDLLMTDVVLPEMSGKDLAKAIQQIRPDIRVLFMSGYTANVIAHQGVLDEGVAFMEKPFTFENLARKVREAMGTRKSERGMRS